MLQAIVLLSKQDMNSHEGVIMKLALSKWGCQLSSIVFNTQENKAYVAFIHQGY